MFSYIWEKAEKRRILKFWKTEKNEKSQYNWYNSHISWLSCHFKSFYSKISIKREFWLFMSFFLIVRKRNRAIFVSRKNEKITDFRWNNEPEQSLTTQLYTLARLGLHLNTYKSKIPLTGVCFRCHLIPLMAARGC